jgi:hypothetical protein
MISRDYFYLRNSSWTEELLSSTQRVALITAWHARCRGISESSTKEVLRIWRTPLIRIQSQQPPSSPEDTSELILLVKETNWHGLYNIRWAIVEDDTWRLLYAELVREKD